MPWHINNAWFPTFWARRRHLLVQKSIYRLANRNYLDVHMANTITIWRATKEVKDSRSWWF